MNRDIRTCLGEFFADSPLLQLALTWLSGKPLHDQMLPKLSAWGHFARATMWLSSGVGLAWFSCSSGNLELLPAAWTMSLYGMRFLQLVVVHNAAHQNFVRNRFIDKNVGFWVSALLMIENFEFYRDNHSRVHHSWKLLSTYTDPTVMSLEKAGMVSGRSVWRLRLSLVIALFSPVYHLRTFYQRIRSYWVASSLHAKLTILFVIICQIVIVVWSETTFTFTVAWLIPVTVLYQQAALLRLVVEHSRDEPTTKRCTREDAAPLTTAVFLGVAPPQTQGVFSWLLWVVQMFGALIVRLVILPGDSGAAHDWHHMHPRGDWPNYLEERRKEVLLRPERYDEVWGYWAALEKSLCSIARENR